MTFLLDVNVVLALLDADHGSHGLAHSWFANEGSDDFATCAIVENGFLRIISHPKYTNPVGSPAEAATALVRMRAQPGHTFWADQLSLVDCALVKPERLRTHAQVTDTYLLALAAARGGRLATLDRRLSPDAVVGGKKALHIIRPSKSALR